MKIFHLLLGASLSAQLHALDSGQLAAVSQKFAQDSGDAQYAARMELNTLVDEATAPGKTDTAEVNKLLIATLNAEQTPAEAKKYLLRVLTRTATADNIAALNAVLTGSDPLLGEEARRVIESIPSKESAAALDGALKGSKEANERIGFINALATQKSTHSIPAIRNLILDPNPDVGRAAVNALGRIGGADAIEVLKNAYVSGKVSPTIKLDLERALLLAASGDLSAASLVFNTTTSDSLRLAAFLALVSGDLSAEKSALLEDGIKSDVDAIRQASLRQGLRSGLPSLQDGLAKGIDQLSPADRFVVLSDLHLLKSSEAVESIATGLLDSKDEAERIAALTALGHLKTKTAFTAVLQALGAREPRVNQAAGSALGRMDFPDGAAVLQGMLNGDSSEDKVLAIKAINYRRLENTNALLLGLISGSDKAAAQEAMKTLYSSASIDDLVKLCTAASSSADPDTKKRLTALCKKIAKRLDSDEARKLVEGLR